ncbi:23S rRNA m(2)A-2503 methyltransferase [Thermaerobacter marianensis DSM 12885]|uniref:Probable dual-specificity RNA methyltransferase RlmN n=1 Tax=Thermaerobacter marianensis (strain ATCC 700841 / DSM 12885 / JCM 10246 / 7p75a) TaxID=644966 RepID=E6SJA7_THEM7|nr:23S rRNA (adenine(2503)-C(2))-methyltransferase RlmN [Thermaerobacter marianensis]ADU51035.1 23S rRNA m(2)A-2503 methyltransferase [Thermaerobacter marianensis DSM 12885]
MAHGKVWGDRTGKGSGGPGVAPAPVAAANTAGAASARPEAGAAGAEPDGRAATEAGWGAETPPAARSRPAWEEPVAAAAGPAGPAETPASGADLAVPTRQWAGLLPEELGRVLSAWGEPAYRGRQIFAWLHRRGVTRFAEMTDLPKDLRRRLEALGDPVVPAVRRLQVDPQDGTRKYLLELEDGQLIETVLMRHRYGLSLCVSSQVGCAMGCRFCASTLGGLVRNLTAAEMAGQLLVVNRDLAERGQRVSHVVVMGIGEPLQNLDATLQFLRVAHHPQGAGISYRHMTVSTSGLVPRIRQLAHAGLPITLAVSLHAPNDALRSWLMPVNRRWPIAELMDACREYVERTGRRITFEYVLIEDVNDRPEHAAELADLVAGLNGHVNLIPWNPVSERPFRAPSPERVQAFVAALRRRGVNVTVRRELGQRIEAACGQLRRRALAEMGSGRA